MIVCRTPFRMSFVGGGSDIPSFFKKQKGAVISTSINKFMYQIIHQTFDKKFHINYSKKECASKINSIKHPIVRNVLKILKIKTPIEISSLADIPSYGSGLGSSSSYTVGLFNALSEFKNTKVDEEYLAKNAYLLERNILKEGAGKQDQYAAAYGGFNLIEFYPDDKVKVKKILCDQKKKKRFEESIITFFTGNTRRAYKNLLSLNENLNKKKNISNVSDMVKLTYEFLNEIHGNFSIYELGKILDENWRIKKTLSSNVSNDMIDYYYNLGKKNGALGGKILGAGNGGFLMFIAPKNQHGRIIKSLKDLEYVKINFENNGSKILMK